MKKKICFVPYENFEVYAIQDWLDSQAVKGYRLERFRFGFAVFRRTQPSKTRYRLDILTSEKYDMEQDIHEDAADQGWQYVCDYAWHNYSVYCAEDPDAPELHTDPAVLRSAMEGRLLARGASLLILLVWLLHQSFMPNGLVAALVNSGGSLLYTSNILYQLTALLLIALLWVLLVCIVVASLIRAMKTFSQGGLVSRRKPWIRPAVYGLINVLALTAIVLIAVFSSGRNSQFMRMDVWPDDAPIPSWESFAPEEYLAYDNDDFMLEPSSPFAEQIIMLRQKGDSDEKSYYYDVDICRMKTPEFAKRLFDAYAREDGAAVMTAEGSTAFVRRENDQVLILLTEKTVIRASYNGAQDLMTLETDL